MYPFQNTAFYLTLSDAASKNPRKVQGGGLNQPPPNEKCHISVIIKTTYFIFSHNENTFVSQVLSHEMIV